MSLSLKISRETLISLAKCFESSEEASEFYNQLHSTITDILNIKKDVDLETEKSIQSFLCQSFMISLFCKKNIELIREMIKFVDYEIVETE